MSPFSSQRHDCAVTRLKLTFPKDRTMLDGILKVSLDQNSQHTGDVSCYNVVHEKLLGRADILQFNIMYVSRVKKYFFFFMCVWLKCSQLYFCIFFISLILIYETAVIWKTTDIVRKHLYSGRCRPLMRKPEVAVARKHFLS